LQLAGIYKNVIATDTSPKQLSLATMLPNIRYQQTPPTMSIAEVESNVAPESSVDVVTIAAAIHWLDRPNFYQQVKWVLKKPHGVIAAWAYFLPEVNDSVDAVVQRFYDIALEPYLEPPVRLAKDKYRSIDFPFEPVDGVDHTEPPLFVIEKLMTLDHYFTFFRSWSAYQIAREKGVELLSDDFVEDFKRAWAEDGQEQKVAKFPIFLRIGRVGNM
jgi:hypothetical protein